MLKKGSLGLLAIGLMFWLATVIAPAPIGKAVFEWAGPFEASIYGLEKQKIDIQEMNLYLYMNEIKAERPTIVMLHGYSADKEVWPRFAKYFTDRYNVLIPDMAGHGETGFHKDWNYGGPAQVNRIIALLDKLKINKVHVIGNSMGGFIAGHFARMYPQRTLTSTLVDPAGVASPIKSDMENMIAAGRNPFLINDREEFDTFYGMTMAKPPYFPDFILEAVSVKYQSKRDELTQIFLDFHGKDSLQPVLGEIKAPVLLLWGDQDQLLHVSAVDVWKAGISNISVKVWPGIGHMPMVEIPEESASVYQAFLDSNS
jgi:pimeloyl-ACP methyl ester carboxylesterase